MRPRRDLDLQELHQEARLRCLMIISIQTSRKPDELIVYGGAGKVGAQLGLV